MATIKVTEQKSGTYTVEIPQDDLPRYQNIATTLKTDVANVIANMLYDAVGMSMVILESKHSDLAQIINRMKAPTDGNQGS